MAISIDFVIIDGMKSNLCPNTLLKTFFRALIILLIPFSLGSCKGDKPTEKDIVRKPELFPDRVRKNLTEIIEYTVKENGRVNDSTSIASYNTIKSIYENNDYTPLWSAEGDWISIGDSLNDFIRNAMNYGLFPDDYHSNVLSVIHQKLKTDSLASKDAAMWSRADVLLTDAFLRITEHLKRGRLPYDSLSRKDTLFISDSFYVNKLDNVVQSKQLVNVLHQLEPALPGYQQLRKAIGAYLDTVTFRKYTYLPYPYTDSVAFYGSLKKRLFEERVIDSLPESIDTAALRAVIYKYQKNKKLKRTGKINEAMVRNLNDTEWERFKRIAITLDKYKLMADTMPRNYVWVNIPGYYLKVIEGDSVALESRVIVGAPKTRTPELYSEISNFITYPQWTVPYSIIFKEMLPAIQKDISYLKKQNLMVVDRYDSVIDPATIDWSKLSKKKFPYLIRQREGDDNSLGVLKFNFRNKYAVYLHDTNARWMFSKEDRALSHGCIRVQDWKDLAHYLVRNDTVKYHTDTLARWIVRQEKHVVTGFKKVPLFIRYFTCDAEFGKIRFYDDIYGVDKILAERYFSKHIN